MTCGGGGRTLSAAGGGRPLEGEGGLGGQCLWNRLATVGKAVEEGEATVTKPLQPPLELAGRGASSCR